MRKFSVLTILIMIFGLAGNLTATVKYGNEESSKKHVRNVLMSPINFIVIPIQLDNSNGKVTLELIMAPRKGSKIFKPCYEIEISIEVNNELEYFGEKSWIQKFKENDTIVKSLEFQLPKDTIYEIDFLFKCTKYEKVFRTPKYLQYKSDTIIFSEAPPHNPQTCKTQFKKA